jgi:hypothetical protein
MTHRSSCRPADVESITKREPEFFASEEAKKPNLGLK